MVLSEHLRTGDDLMEITLHKLGKDIDLMEEVDNRRL